MTHAATSQEIAELLEQVADNGRLPSDLQTGIPAMAERINKLVEAFETLIDDYDGRSGAFEWPHDYRNAQNAIKEAREALADYCGTKE